MIRAVLEPTRPEDVPLEVLERGERGRRAGDIPARAAIEVVDLPLHPRAIAHFGHDQEAEAGDLDRINGIREWALIERGESERGVADMAVDAEAAPLGDGEVVGPIIPHLTAQRRRPPRASPRKGVVEEGRADALPLCGWVDGDPQPRLVRGHPWLTRRLADPDEACGLVLRDTPAPAPRRPLVALTEHVHRDWLQFDRIDERDDRIAVGGARRRAYGAHLPARYSLHCRVQARDRASEARQRALRTEHGDGLEQRRRGRAAGDGDADRGQ